MFTIKLAVIHFDNIKGRDSSKDKNFGFYFCGGSFRYLISLDGLICIIFRCYLQRF